MGIKPTILQHPSLFDDVLDVVPERSGDGGDNLSDQTVQVGVRWPFNVEVATADVVDGLVVDHEGAIGVLQGGVGRQDRVVWLDDGSGHLGCRVYGELQLGLLAVVNREAFHQERGKSGSSSTT